MKSKELFDMIFGTFLLILGSTLLVSSLGAITWNSILTLLNIPYIGILFAFGIVISVMVLIVSIAMLYYGVKMVNRGAGAFKGIIFGTIGAILCLLAVITEILSVGGSSLLSIPVFIAGVAFLDFASGAKVTKRVMEVVPKI